MHLLNHKEYLVSCSCNSMYLMDEEKQTWCTYRDIIERIMKTENNEQKNREHIETNSIAFVFWALIFCCLPQRGIYYVLK